MIDKGLIKIFDSNYNKMHNDMQRLDFLSKINEKIMKSPSNIARMIINSIAKSKFSYLYYVNFFDNILSFNNLIDTYDILESTIDKQFPDELQIKMYELYKRNKEYYQDKKIFYYIIRKYNKYYIRDIIQMNKDDIKNIEASINISLANMEISSCNNIYLLREFRLFVEREVSDSEAKKRIYDEAKDFLFINISSLKELSLFLSDIVNNDIGTVILLPNDRKEIIECLKILKANNFHGKIHVFDYQSNVDFNYLQEIRSLVDNEVMFCNYLNVHMMNLNDLLNANKILDNYAREINSVKIIDGKEVRLSPFEKIVAIYKIATLYGEYNEREFSFDASSSRNVYRIVSQKDTPLVCLGYVAIMQELLKRCNVKENSIYPVAALSEKADHATMILHIKDDKYNLNGLYISNPTEDSIEPAYIERKKLSILEYKVKINQGMHARFNNAFLTIEEFRKYANKNYSLKEKGINYQKLNDYLDEILPYLDSGSIEYLDLFGDKIIANASEMISLKKSRKNNHQQLMNNVIDNDTIIKALVNIQKFVNKGKLEVNEDEVERIKYLNGFYDELTENGKELLFKEYLFTDYLFYLYNYRTVNMSNIKLIKIISDKFEKINNMFESLGIKIYYYLNKKHEFDMTLTNESGDLSINDKLIFFLQNEGLPYGRSDSDKNFFLIKFNLKMMSCEDIIYFYQKLLENLTMSKENITK